MVSRSRRCETALGWLGREGAAVAYEGPEGVEAAPGEGEDGLLVGLALAPRAFVERPGDGAAAGGGLGGEVEDPQEATVVAVGPAHVAADASGVPGNRCQAGDSGQTAGAAEGVHVAARCRR